MNESLHVLAELRRDCEDASLAEYRARTAAPRPGRPGRPALPALDQLAGADLRQVLADRRSLRFFSDEPVGAGLISGMVRAAQEADAMLWPGQHATGPLEFYVAARHVTGLAPAIYVCASGGFARIAGIPGTPSMEAMVLQPEFGLAAALVVAVGSLETALAGHRSHGHRLLLERSGAACEAAWLAAVQAGHGGSIFAGFLPAVLKSLVGVDGFRRTQLLALAVGKPAPAYAGQTRMGPPDRPHPVTSRPGPVPPRGGAGPGITGKEVMSDDGTGWARSRREQ